MIFEFLSKHQDQLLPLLLSCITAYTMLLAGNLNKRAWLVGLFNQMLWLTWIISSENYGFIPMNVVMWIVYYRNHLKWRRVVSLNEQLLKQSHHSK